MSLICIMHPGTYAADIEGKRLQVSELGRRDLQQPRVLVGNASRKRLVGGESIYTEPINTRTT